VDFERRRKIPKGLFEITGEGQTREETLFLPAETDSEMDGRRVLTNNESG